MPPAAADGNELPTSPPQRRRTKREKGKIRLSESPLTIEDTEPDRKAGSRGDNRRASRNGRLRGSANERSNRRLLRTVRSSPNRLPAKREKRPSRCRAGEDRTLRHSAAFRAPSGGAKAAAAKTRPLFLRAAKDGIAVSGPRRRERTAGSGSKRHARFPRDGIRRTAKIAYRILIKPGTPEFRPTFAEAGKDRMICNLPVKPKTIRVLPEECRSEQTTAPKRAFPANRRRAKPCSKVASPKRRRLKTDARRPEQTRRLIPRRGGM